MEPAAFAARRFKTRGQRRIRRTELDQWLDARPGGRGDEGERDGEARVSCRELNVVLLDSDEEIMNFDEFFKHLVQCDRHAWQARLSLDGTCRDRLIRIPTGFGKTAGVTLAWLWNRIIQSRGAWPRRLVLCLPMRTLVEQTERAVRQWIERGNLESRVQSHVLMGGLSPSSWHLEPDQNAVLIFDTGPDLSGADVDISRFVREGDDRDVTVWWWPLPEGQTPHRRLRPAHDALCRIPIGDARKWLAGGAGKTDDGEFPVKEAGDGSKKGPPRAWVWSYLDGEWERLEARHVYPGLTILVDAGAGGYDVQVGFTAKVSKIPVVAEHVRAIEAADAADSADEQDELSEGLGQSNRQYKTIATHGAEVAIEVQRIATALELHKSEARVLELAGLAHDVGKAHPAFASAIRDRNGIVQTTRLAKAPKGRWHRFDRTRDIGIYDHSDLGKRPGFRHELASALALLELAWMACPDHPALQGGREELLDLTVGREVRAGPDERIEHADGLIAELIRLDETRFNLVAYAVMCHHGKVRASLPMSAHDQGNPDEGGNLPIRGVRDGDLLPALALADTDGHDLALPPVRLRLDAANAGLSRRYGPSWVERVLALRKHYGDFQLAWFEMLLRVADIRASQIAEPRDSRIAADLVEVQSVPPAQDRSTELREWIDRTLASAASEPSMAKPRGTARGRSETKRVRTLRKATPSGTAGGRA